MNESLFQKYLLSFFPKLQTLIEKINNKRGDGGLTYLHKDSTILRKVYSVDNKWEADTVNTSYMAADYVAADSPLPLKARDTISRATGKLPKVGMKKNLKESEINALNIMEAQGGQVAEIRRKLAQDSVACSVGIDERNEYALLYGLSNGYVAIKDEDSPNLLRINFQYQDDNKFGVADTDEGLTVDDLKGAIERADNAGNTIIQFWIAKSTFDKLKKTDSAKQLVATYRGQTYDSSTTLPTPTTAAFQEAFEDETGVTFRIINRTVRLETDGTTKSVKPWNANMVIGVCNTMIGALVYGRLAEQTNPVANVQYQTVDSYKLISKYSKTDPLVETTSGQAYVLPVIEDVDTIYQIDITESDPYVSVDTTAEASDTEDVYVTINGTTYSKSEAITVLNDLGASLSSDASDEEIIDAYNALSAAKKKTFASTATAVTTEDSTEEETTE